MKTLKIIKDIKLRMINNGCLEFNKRISSMKIENINFDDIEMGNFTMFNAFFLTDKIK